MPGHDNSEPDPAPENEDPSSQDSNYHNVVPNTPAIALPSREGLRPKVPIIPPMHLLYYFEY